MKIYLMRHAEAVSPSEWFSSDRSRPLTPQGAARLTAAVAEMKKLNFSAGCLLVSPFLRAVQTADLISKALPDLKPEICNELAAGAPPETLRRLCLKFKDSAPVWVVGHMPELAVFGSRLTLEAWILDSGLKPGEVLAVEAPTLDKEWGAGRVLWQRGLDDWKKGPL